jgi:hypothetical protein
MSTRRTRTVARIAKIPRGSSPDEQPDEPTPVVAAEELETSLSETIDRFLDAAEVASRRLRDQREPKGRAIWTASRVSPRSREEIAAESFDELGNLLRDEIAVVGRFEGDDGIADTEREREIAKGALAVLRKDELQRAASDLKLPKSGNKIDLLNRLVDHLDANPHEVARLISSVERSPSEGRRHAARLFLFDSLPSPDALIETLKPFEERYVRTDLARWFVLEDVEPGDGVITAKGKLRTYDIDVLPQTLDAHQRNSSVELQIKAGESVLHAYSRLEPESMAAVGAFALFVDEVPLSPLERVTARPTWGATAAVDDQTAWLIGLLLGLLEDPNMTLEDVTSASFERPRGEGAPVGRGVPYVASTRLRGQHVLDSQSASRHLASAERLSGVTAMVRFKRTNEESFVSLPVRLAVAPAYVAVMTGFGAAGVEESRRLHRRLEDYVVRQLEEPVTDLQGRVDAVLDAMLGRANASQPPDTADLFARVSRGRVRVDT